MMEFYIAKFKYGQPKMSKVWGEKKPSTYQFDRARETKLVGDFLRVPHRIPHDNLDKEVGGMFVSVSMVACLSWLIDKLETHQQKLLDDVAGLTQKLMIISALKAIAEMRKGEYE
jgi:hypothetical protein